MSSDISDSEAEGNSSYNQTRTKKRKIPNEIDSNERKNYDQKFRKEWLNDPLYKDWLSETSNPRFCKCKLCNIELHCGKTNLKRHAATTKHLNNIKKIRNTSTIADHFKAHTSQCQQEKLHMQNVAKAEILLSCFFAEHNIAFQAIDHLLPLLKKMAPDSKIIADMKLGRTKCTNIVKNVIYKKEMEDLVTDLKNNKFSVLVDESTDISSNKNLAIVVRYMINDCIKNNLLGLLTIDAKDGSAANLFDTFSQFLIEHDIPMTNIIGLATDNASVMLGKNNSFKTRLENSTNMLITIPCICHSSALVASKACSVLPKTPEEFIRSVTTYFAFSSKRIAELKEMQEYFQTETNKLLQLSCTRWLSRHQCIVRILQNWDVLERYFTVSVFEDKSKQSDFILEQLKNKCNKAYFYFLKYVLNFFNAFNALFQSKKLLIHELSKECKRLFRQILTNFVKPNLINNIVNVCFSDPNLFLDLEKIDLGVDCNALLKEIPEPIAKEIRKKCLEFYTVACQELKKRMPPDTSLFDSLIFLKPEIATSNSKPEIVVSLSNVSQHFKNIVDPQIVENQWKLISIFFEDEEKNSLIKLSPETFWHKLSEMKKYDDTYYFDQICSLAKVIMSLPHSNAETERVFSIVSDVKCKKRNKLGHDALNAVSVIRYSLEKCYDFEITQKHLDLMKYTNLYDKEIE